MFLCDENNEFLMVKVIHSPTYRIETLSRTAIFSKEVDHLHINIVSDKKNGHRLLYLYCIFKKPRHIFTYLKASAEKYERKNFEYMYM